MVPLDHSSFDIFVDSQYRNLLIMTLVRIFLTFDSYKSLVFPLVPLIFIVFLLLVLSFKI